jgi:hypothetical protein
MIHKYLLILLFLLLGTAAAAENFSLPTNTSSFLERYCYDCHDEDTQKGDVRLDNLSSLSKDIRLDLLNRIQEQIFIKSMPPKKKKKQPLIKERDVLFHWVSGELDKHSASKLAGKLLKPHYGNYIDHDKLFSGEIKDDAFSPARLWRRNTYHFDVAKKTYFGDHKNPKKTLGPIGSLKQPFNKGSGEGISDFAALFYADSGNFDTLYRNAEFVVDRSLLMAFIEYDYKSQGKTMKDWDAERAKVLEAQKSVIEKMVKEGKNPRYVKGMHGQLNAKYRFKTPQVYRDIILGKGKPTKAQMEAAVKYHFYRTGQNVPTKETLYKFTKFMGDSIEKTDSYFGLRNTLIAILVTPEYVYRSELGLGKDLGDGRFMLSPVELAYAISYALTDSKPDVKLLEAVKSGTLNSREDVKREVERLLADNNIDKPRILRFFHEFFGYHHAPGVFKDEARFFKFYTRVAKNYVKDADVLVNYILKKDKDVFKELLTTEKYFVSHSGDNKKVKAEVEVHKKLYAYFKDKNWKGYAKNAKKKEKISDKDLKYAQSLHLEFRNLKNANDLQGEFKRMKAESIYAKMKLLQNFEKKGITSFDYSLRRGRDARFKRLLAYNISGNDWDFPVEQPFVLDKGKRAGILSHPSWLIAHSLNATTDPVRRGKWIRERLLADNIPDVPITVDAVVPEDHHKTLRERYGVTEAKSCWNCHKKMNPLGYPFEMFDDFGRWRDKENMEGLPKKGKSFQTKAINSKGYLEGTGDKSLDGEVRDAIDLVQRLAQSRRVQQSFIRHAFRYWMGRNEFLSDSKTLISAEKAYVDNGGSFKAMLISLLISDSFIYRKRQ